MTPKHIYDSEGYWIAFVVGPEVFLRGGEWLGSLTGQNEIRDHDGNLRGLLDERDQLSVVTSMPARMSVP